MEKKILGLKVAFDRVKNAKTGVESITSAVGWAFIKQGGNDNKGGYLDGLTDEQKAIEARKLIAEFVKQRRVELGYSIERIAEVSGISIAEVESIEVGAVYSIDSFLLLTHGLNCYFLLTTKE